jgi:hypothetical protein
VRTLEKRMAVALTVICLTFIFLREQDFQSRR